MRDLWALVQETRRAAGGHELARLSTALAYYTIFSLAPVLVIAVAVAGFVFGPDAASGELQRQLNTYMGRETAAMVGQVVAASSEGKTGTVATLVGIATLLIGASGAFLQLQHALNRVWSAQSPQYKGVQKFFRRRVLGFGMVLVAGFLLAVSMLLSAAVTAWASWVDSRVSISPAVLEASNFALSIVVIWGLFAMIYKILPDAKVAWGDVWAGALGASVAFALGKSLIGLYLGFVSIDSMYGAAGAPIVLMLWVNFSARILLVGAEFTRAWAVGRGSWKGRVYAPEVRGGSLRSTLAGLRSVRSDRRARRQSRRAGERSPPAGEGGAHHPLVGEGRGDLSPSPLVGEGRGEGEAG